MPRKTMSQSHRAVSEDERHIGTRRIQRKQLLQGAGLGVLGMFAGLHAAPVAAQAQGLNQGKGKSVEGSWHVTVHVDGTPDPFDTLYAFAPGGVFVRVDGRNNAPSLGYWKKQGKNSIAIAFIVFNFNASGQRTGTITALATATLKGDTISGPFSATAVDMSSKPLAGFPKTGTFEGTRIQAQTP